MKYLKVLTVYSLLILFVFFGLIYVSPQFSFQVYKVMQRMNTEIHYSENGDVETFHFKDFPGIKKVHIQMLEEDFSIIEKERKEALKMGMIFSENKQYHPCKIAFKDGKFSGKVKLKGDYIDHITHPFKWSFKVKWKDNNGAKQVYTLVSPNTRSFLAEFVFRSIAQRLGFETVPLETVFLELSIGGEKRPLGLYFLEQTFKSYCTGEEKINGAAKIDENTFFELRRGILSANGEKELREIHMLNYFSDHFINSETCGKLRILKDFKVRELSELSALNSTGECLSDTSFDYQNLSRFLILLNLIGSYHSGFWWNLQMIEKEGRFQFVPNDCGFHSKMNYFRLPDEGRFFSACDKEKLLLQLEKDLAVALEIDLDGIVAELSSVQAQIVTEYGEKARYRLENLNWNKDILVEYSSFIKNYLALEKLGQTEGKKEASRKGN